MLHLTSDFQFKKILQRSTLILFFKKKQPMLKSVHKSKQTHIQKHTERGVIIMTVS